MSSGSTVGGVETWLTNIVKALPGAGYEPIVALTKGAHVNNPDQYRQMHPNMPCIEVNGAGLPRSSRVLACLRIIKKVRPAIVLPLGLIDAVPACGLAKSDNKEVRIIARTQGLLAPMLADLEDFESVFDLAVCDGLLNVRYLRDAIGFPQELIRHVPNGAREPLRRRMERKAQSPIRLVYVGRLTSGDKRANDLVKLAHELDAIGLNYTLVIVGDGPQRSALEAAFVDHKKITFTGSLSHDSVYRDIYPNADCLVSLSSSESFGISIVEAMMNGVVPISSRFLGWKTVGTIEDGVTALSFEIGDMKSAAANIAMLSKSPDLLNVLSIRGANKAHSEYSWGRCISRWTKIFDELPAIPQRVVAIDCNRFLTSHSGKLNRLPLPPKVVDFARRMRLRLSPRAKPGGEEWPLYLGHHSEQRLDSISQVCATLDS